MARKPKAVRPEAEDKTQAERFLETAREIGVDETGEAFERAMDKIVPPRRPSPTGSPESRPRQKPPR
jgi:hypothetical protein